MSEEDPTQFEIDFHAEMLRGIQRRRDDEKATVERLTRERDEAREERDAALKQIFRGDWGKELLDEAETRGYERGIREAAGLAEHWLGPDSYCQAAILALLEKPLT